MATLQPIGLFTTFAERAMLRVDEVVMNRDCKWPISVAQYELLKQLRVHQGIARAMPLGELCERLKLTPRQVKDLVQDLRLNFGIQIGASRDSEAGGYYIAANLKEIEESIQQMWNQAITMLRVCKAMRGPQCTAQELAGQVRLHLEKEVA
jgi:hypothetical protein